MVSADREKGEEVFNGDTSLRAVFLSDKGGFKETINFFPEVAAGSECLAQATRNSERLLIFLDLMGPPHMAGTRRNPQTGPHVADNASSLVQPARGDLA